MRNRLPAPPAGSCFQTDEDDLGQPRLSWLPAASLIGRWFGAGFLAFWLCGWLAGEVFATKALVEMIGNGIANGFAGFEWFGALFLTGWLGFWTFGGIAAMFALRAMIRRPQAERLTFGDGELRYEPGTLAGGEHGTSWGDPRRVIPRDELGPIKLDGELGRQRLTLDHGADRIEIGACLREPEREWLARILKAWAGQADEPDLETED
jgi:hypothetical protein